KERGHVADMGDAFERYLGRGKPAYVPRCKLTPHDAVALIRDHGGMSSLAHPVTLNLEGHALYDYVSSLLKQGLEGVEAFHRLHDQAASRRFSDLAGSMGLVVTGGSDYHGLEPGECPMGGAGLTDELFEVFLDRLEGRRGG
ncbi:MAG TPA: phosphatase, partial [Deltaproteobacteria bacterium]|nr:phosphatase [Deltaproteobacteria bacterium]